MRSVKQKLVVAASVAALMAAGSGVAMAQGGGGGQQQPAAPTVPHASQTEALVSEMASMARGMPYLVDSPTVPPSYAGTDRAGQVPDGVTPLARDLWNTPNFYLDREYVTPTEYTDWNGVVHPAGSTVNLWQDPRYFHCNGLRALTDIWTQSRVSGSTPEEMSANAQWGDCSVTVDRDLIVSPYPFESAYEHYNVLMAEAEARGGPTTPSYEWLLDVVSGAYNRGGVSANQQWLSGRNIQPYVYQSLLTPVHQTYQMQQIYYEAVRNSAQWSASLSYPEGFLRWWRFGGGDPRYIYATPHVITFIGDVADNVVKQIHIGREFEDPTGPIPWLGSQVAAFYGKFIGFWDGDMLVTWMSGVQPWFAHTTFEYSAQMQVVETWTSIYDENGCHTGWNSEAVFYDPLALVEPIWIEYQLNRRGGCSGIATSLLTAPPRNWDYLQSQYNVGGIVTPVPAGTVIDHFLVPDLRGRPWAQNWIHYFEQDLDLPPGIPGRTDQVQLDTLF